MFRFGRIVLQWQVKSDSPRACEKERERDNGRKKEKMTAMLNVRSVFAFKVVCSERKHERDNCGNLRIKAGNKREANDNLKSTKCGSVARAVLESKRLKQRSVLTPAFAEGVSSEIQEDHAKREPKQKWSEETERKQVGEWIEHGNIIPLTFDF